MGHYTQKQEKREIVVIVCCVISFVACLTCRTLISMACPNAMHINANPKKKLHVGHVEGKSTREK